jgi:DNA mismatch endonuclease, patch repair protein
MMSRIRSTNTGPERKVRSAAHMAGLRFRIHARDLPGKPDLVNRRKRWAIFVHGCFWHSHEGCKLASRPRSNAAYWQPKLKANAARDQGHYRALLELGFQVFIIWECETRSPDRLINAIQSIRNRIINGVSGVQMPP